MADGYSVNAESGEVAKKNLTVRELAQRAQIRAEFQNTRQQQELREQNRRNDLELLKTAEPGQIGRIIARLLDA